MTLTEASDSACVNINKVDFNKVVKVVSVFSLKTVKKYCVFIHQYNKYNHAVHIDNHILSCLC